MGVVAGLKLPTWHCTRICGIDGVPAHVNTFVLNAAALGTEPAV